MRSVASSMSKHSTPSVSLDISPITLPTDMATHNVSLGAAKKAADTLHDVKSRDLQRTIIKQSLNYRTLFYTPTYAQTWGQDSDVQKSMIAILTAFGTLEKFDDRFNYGLGDRTIYRSHDGDPDPKRDKINRQLVEWVSEGQRSYLPTFEEALGEMSQLDSAYNTFAVALANVRRLRHSPTADQLNHKGQGRQQKDRKIEDDAGEDDFLGPAASSRWRCLEPPPIDTPEAGWTM